MAMLPTTHLRAFFALMNVFLISLFNTINSISCTKNVFQLDATARLYIRVYFILFSIQGARTFNLYACRLVHNMCLCRTLDMAKKYIYFFLLIEFSRLTFIG